VSVELPEEEVKELLLPGAQPVSLEKQRWATVEDTELLDLLQGECTPARENVDNEVLRVTWGAAGATAGEAAADVLKMR